MKKHLLVPIGSAFLLVVLLGGAWLVLKDGPLSVNPFGTVRPSSITSAESYQGPVPSEEYRNGTFHFTLKKPEGFTANEMPKDENDGSTVILQNTAGEGIQIYVTPADASRHTLTADDIHQSLPDLMVKDPEAVTVGPAYTGVAFLSDNGAFDGASREVWFYFRGNLYQISTYARFDGLLKAMFATWTFY